MRNPHPNSMTRRATIPYRCQKVKYTSCPAEGELPVLDYLAGRAQEDGEWLITFNDKYAPSLEGIRGSVRYAGRRWYISRSEHGFTIMLLGRIPAAF